MPDFSILQTPNFAQAALAGYQAGRNIGKERRREAALATYVKDPEAGVEAALSSGDIDLADALEKRNTVRQRREILTRVFDQSQRGKPNGGALSPANPAPAPMPAMSPTPSQASGPQMLAPGAGVGGRDITSAYPQGSPLSPAPIAPQGGVGGPVEAPAFDIGAHPLEMDLPDRLDGLTLNQGALRELYALDPESAKDIQAFVYKSDEAAIKSAAARGEAMAIAADALAQVPVAQRPMEFRRWAQYLVERGFPPEELAQADLSDEGLVRHFRAGQTLAQIVAAKKDARDFEATQQERQRDNARADAGLAVRQEALGLAKGREARVASGKGKGGKSGGNDNSDLNYLLGP